MWLRLKEQEEKKKGGAWGFDERGKETQEDRSIVKEQRSMND